MATDISVIIPTFDAAGSLGPTLTALRRETAWLREIVIADGGSRDATMNIAAAHGASFLRAPRGRGAQLAHGTAAATGKWLLFLHADTMLERGWSDAAGRFINDPGNTGSAAYFRYALDEPAPAARRLEAMVAWRCRTLALPYGDQGLLIEKSFYDELGGFRPMRLMEDVDLVRRIGRSRLCPLDPRAVTSGARYRRSGYLPRSARNLFCLGLYFIGAPNRLIAWLYG